ncbi:MAG TPA: tetratricopeptide repeat protein [Bacteroidia bacterium]|nr:tetratricopeptide repeat protein [Bacteroidia bacterium]
MKNKLIVFLLLFSLKSFSQSNNVQSAINYFKGYERGGKNKQGEIANAKRFIDMSAEDASTANDPKMWYYKGKIYHAIDSDSSSAINQIDDNAAGKAATSFINFLKTATKKYDAEITEANDLVWISGVGLFNRAGEAYNKSDFERAAKYYNEIFDILPLDKNNNMKRNNITPDVLNLNLYYVYKKAKNPDKSKEYLQKLIDAKYNDPVIYLNMSRIYLDQKDTVKALSCIEQGRKIFEENPNLISEEINIYMAQGKTDVLISKITDAIAATPDNEQLYFNRGTLYKNNNQNDKAIDDFKKAIELKPDYFDANYNLGATYFNMAGELVNKANKIPPDKQKEYNEAKTKADAKFKEAQPFLEKAYELNPKDKNTVNSLKQLYARIGDLKKAEEMKKVLEELK